MSSSPRTASAAHWPFTGDSDMAARMRDFPWETTPVGAVANWPGSLKNAVATLLECRLPMYLAWGPAFTQFYNDAYRPILGKKDAQALGAAAPDIWNEIWPTIGPMWQEVLAGKAIGFDDFKLTIERFGYPEDCYFNFSYSAVHDDEGRACGVLVTFAETTKLVLAERRLRFLDELSQAVRGLSDPSSVMNTTAAMLGRHLGANRCAYAQVHDDEDTFDLIGDHNEGVDSIVGRYRFTDFGEVVHQSMLQGLPYVNPDVDGDSQTAGSDLTAYRRTQIQAVICVPLHKKGRFVAAMAVHQAVPRRWSREEVELVQTVVDRCWDSLERLRAEAAVREEAHLLELLNRVGTALSAELDLQALLQRVTDAATALTGARFGAFFYNGEDAKGGALTLYTLSGASRQSFEQLGHPRPTDLLGPTFRGGPPIRIDDVRSDPRYGRWAPLQGMPADHLPVRSYLAVPVVTRSGDIVGSLLFGHPEPAVFTDRSERLAVGIASHAAIAFENARLYARAQQAAEERHRLLDSERAARMEAERANAVKDQFLATLSHELRTPLSAINGWVHVLRKRLGSAQQPDLLKGVDVIERSTRLQVQLINDLLDMSRITSGKLALDMVPLEPVGVVQAAIDVISPSADASGVRLTAALDKVGQVMGDAGRLQQVVWNLLANAVKFTPKGGNVHVALRAVDGMAEITVQDTGAGIATDILPHIFERFRQADSSITRRFGGLGLGLSIVQHLVERHGGTVAAQSEGSGHGAAFTVRLPLLTASLKDERAHPRAGHAPQEAMAHPAEALNGAGVLVVDDDPDVRELLERALREAGAEVALAGNGEEALAAMALRPPELLISDIGMPGMDGYALLRRIRKLPRAQGGQVPAIAVTAFARPEDRQRALEAGFAAHFTKPFDPVEVLAMAARLLAEAHPGGDVDGAGAAPASMA